MVRSTCLQWKGKLCFSWAQNLIGNEVLESKRNQAARRTEQSIATTKLIVPHLASGGTGTARRRAAAAPRVAWAAGADGRRSVSGRGCTCSTASASVGTLREHSAPLFGSVPATCIQERQQMQEEAGEERGTGFRGRERGRYHGESRSWETGEARAGSCGLRRGRRRKDVEMARGWRRKCRPDLYCREAE